MKNLIYIILCLLLFQSTVAQENITLGDCYAAALDRHPIRQEREQLRALWELKDLNLKSSLYPTIDAGASILYNSSVVDLGDALSSLPVPGIADAIGGMPRDQYKVTLDINQVFWDGGMTRSVREAERAALMVNEKEVEISLYATRQKINDLYFQLAILKEREILLRSWLEVISSRLRVADAAIKNGVITPSERDIIAAEEITLKQQLVEISIASENISLLLSDITGLPINGTTGLLLPEIEIDPSHQDELSRPELAAIDLRIEQAEAGRSVLKSSRMPKAYGFATLGYGSPPGNNFFSDSFDTYAIVGAGLKWNIFDWNNSGRKGEMININKQILEGRRSEIEENLNRALTSRAADIERMKVLIASGEELITLRHNITMAGDSRFRNGTITSTEYMAILNQEKEAILTNSINRINLVKLQVDYMNIKGDEIK